MIGALGMIVFFISGSMIAGTGVWLIWKSINDPDRKKWAQFSEKTVSTKQSGTPHLPAPRPAAGLQSPNPNTDAALPPRSKTSHLAGSAPQTSSAPTESVDTSPN